MISQRDEVAIYGNRKELAILRSDVWLVDVLHQFRNLLPRLLNVNGSIKLSKPYSRKAIKPSIFTIKSLFLEGRYWTTCIEKRNNDNTRMKL